MNVIISFFLSIFLAQVSLLSLSSAESYITQQNIGLPLRFKVYTPPAHPHPHLPTPTPNRIPGIDSKSLDLLAHRIGRKRVHNR